MDDHHEDCRAARIAKKEQDKRKKRPRMVRKKRLYILFDPNIKAFQVWEAVAEPRSLATCEILLNDATLRRHSHLHAMEFVGNAM
jgi:hypothetical protein